MVCLSKPLMPRYEATCGCGESGKHSGLKNLCLGLTSSSLVTRTNMEDWERGLFQVFAKHSWSNPPLVRIEYLPPAVETTTTLKVRVPRR